jgi:hypothetical protein
VLQRFLHIIGGPLGKLGCASARWSPSRLSARPTVSTERDHAEFGDPALYILYPAQLRRNFDELLY